MATRARTIGCLAVTLALAACGDEAPVPEDAGDPAELDAGAQHDAADDAGQADTGDAGLEDVRDAGLEDAGDARALLSATGLYADLTRDVLADGVVPFTPAAALWSDSADKRRWIALPPGTEIDTRNMDGWVFPVGTKLWKEFSLHGQRLETRLLEKTADARWEMVAYQWRTDGSDAEAVPEGVKNAAGTRHDIPSTKTCKRCHDGVADVVIGFSAVLLDHEGEGATLASLVADGLVSDAPSGPLTVPGSDSQRATLLYLHANCGNCHNDRTFISNVTDVDYFLNVATLGSVDTTNARRTLLRDLRKSGAVAQTDAYRRMSARGIQGQMPPIASELADEEGVALLEGWLEELLPLAAAQP